MYSNPTCCGAPSVEGYGPYAYEEYHGGGLGWFAQAVAAIPAVTQAYSSLTGGDTGSGHCWTRYDNRPFSEPCATTPDYDAVGRMVERAPNHVISKLIGYLLGANSGSGPKSRADLARPECIPFWVKAILGGKGCTASKYPEAPGWFLSQVQEWGEPSNPLENLPGSFIPPAYKPGLSTGATLAVAGLSLFFLPKLIGKGR